MCVIVIPGMFLVQHSNMPGYFHILSCVTSLRSLGGGHVPTSRRTKGTLLRTFLPLLLICSCGQSEEAIPGVTEQQPVGRGGRGHPSARGHRDCRHPLLEAVPHRQAGFPARHGGQHSAAAEGKRLLRCPHEHLHGAETSPDLDTEGRGRAIERTLRSNGVGVSSVFMFVYHSPSSLCW